MSVHYDLTYAEYSQLPGWNWSVIKHMKASPLHVRHAKDHPRPDTQPTQWLRAVHALTLEPAKLFKSFAVFQGEGDRRNKPYKAFKARMDEAGDRRPILMQHDFERATEVAQAVHHHPAARRILEQGRAEVSLTWVDPDTELPCKCRIDWLSPPAIWDLKTLGTTQEHKIRGMVARHLYHGQLAHYRAGCIANGIDIDTAGLLVVEGRPPNDVRVLELDPGGPHGFLHIGERLRREFLQRLAECVASDTWPGVDMSVSTLTPPLYELPDDEIEFENEDFATGGEFAAPWSA